MNTSALCRVSIVPVLTLASPGKDKTVPISAVSKIVHIADSTDSDNPNAILPSEFASHMAKVHKRASGRWQLFAANGFDDFVLSELVFEEFYKD